MGALLSPGKRPVAAALRVMGVSHDVQLQHYHRGLTRALWSGRAASQRRHGLLVSAFAPTGPSVSGLDDTIERRRGAPRTAHGIYRAPVRSAHAHCVTASGWRWLCVRRRVQMPRAARMWALPLLPARCPSARYCSPADRSCRFTSLRVLNHRHQVAARRDMSADRQRLTSPRELAIRMHTP